MLSLPSLPGDGNNWRQNCFRDFFRMEEWGPRELLDICFCSSSQCHVWCVPPDGWNCCVISRPLWCWHRNLLPHGVSWDSHHSDVGEKKTPYPSINVTLRQLKTEWKYLHLFPQSSLKDHIPRVCSLFIIQSYCFTLLSRVKVATSS